MGRESFVSRSRRAACAAARLSLVPACVILALTLCAAAAPADAPLVPVGAAPGMQSQVRAVSDGAGGAILAWIDARPDAPGIYVQRLDAAGAPLWAANGVRIFTPPLGAMNPWRSNFGELENDLAIAADGAGGAIVAWKDSVGPDESDILAQRVDGAGTVRWDVAGVPACRAAGRQDYPELVADGAGGAIVAWDDWRETAPTVYAQRVSAAGSCAWATDGVPASDAEEGLQAPEWSSLFLSAASDGQGGAVLAWASLRGIVAQRLGAGGAPLWSGSGTVVVSHIRNETLPRIAPDGNHGAFVTWSDYRNGGSGVYAQHVDGAGATRWAADGVAVVDDWFDSWYSTVVADAAGGCFVLWQDTRPYFCGPCEGSYVCAQRLDADGNARWTPGGIVASDATRGEGADHMRIHVEAAPDGSGGVDFAYMLCRNYWGGLYTTYAQRLRADGTRATSADLEVAPDPADQRRPVLVRGSNGVIVAWEDARDGDWSIYARQVGGAIPRRPSIQGIEYTALGCRLWWGRDLEPGFATFRLYRGNTVDFPLSPETLIATLSDTSYFDPTGTTWWLYKITAVDVHGNESDPSCFSPGMPTPALVSLVRASARPGEVRVEWAIAAGVTRATVYRARPGADWHAVGQLSPDGTGRLVHVDRSVSAGGRYGYRLGLPDGGEETLGGEVWVNVPAPSFALEGMRPNPVAGREAAVCFSLPDAMPAALEVLDVSGRSIVRREVGALGAGAHTLALPEAAGLAPGVYFLRLTGAGSALTKPVAIVR